MYYFLTQDLEHANNIIEVVGHTPITGNYLWTAGHKFSDPVPPQTLALDPQYGTDFPDFFDTTIPLMSNALIAALRQAGVDNFDAYPMILRRPDTGETRRDYQAVNVIGRLDALDPDHSTYYEEYFEYDRVAVDPARTHGLKCFRLKEFANLIVIEGSVAKHLMPLGFKAVQILSLDDYRGLPFLGASGVSAP